MIEYRDLEPQLRGLWPEIFASIGVTIPKMRGKNSVNGPCPVCNDGTDRAHWRETDGRMSLYCRVCAPDTMHSPEAVFMAVCGVSFGEMVEQLARYVNHIPLEVKAEIKHQVSKNSEQPYSAILPESQCNEYLMKLKHVPLNTLTMRHALGLNGLMVNKEFHACIAITKKFNDAKRVCNVAIIDDNEQVSWLAGKQTQYGYCTIGERRKGKPVYVCSSWIDAQIAYIVTSAEIICAFSAWNMRDILSQYVDMVSTGMIRAVCNRDFNEIAEIEKVSAECQIILPATKTIKECNFKFERMVYKAESLLDSGMIER